MPEIYTFEFSKDNIPVISQFHYAQNWPVNYILRNKKELYIGETTFFVHRIKQHLDNGVRKNLTTVDLITDEQFHKSCTLDIESLLIQFLAAENRYKLQNGNKGLKSHNYYDKELYEAKFALLWEKLRHTGIAHHTLESLKNSDLFKFSPYKVLTEDQMDFVEYFVDHLTLNNDSYIIHGGPGTGKTVLAVYLIKYLVDELGFTKNSLALVVPMTSLRSTLKKVFSKVKGLSAQMVIGPADVVKKEYELLIVDEAHRLKRRRNITNYKSFDDINKLLGLGTDGNELDWIIHSSKQQILFYDEEQSIKPSDIPKDVLQKFINKNDIVEYRLTEQLRMMAGNEFQHFLDGIFYNKKKEIALPSYEIQLFDELSDMVSAIKEQDRKIGLCRIVAGYAWDWSSKEDTTGQIFDIEINGTKLRWNSTIKDWVNTPNSINEVGCIHTIQGYELNYIGVIIGPELGYNSHTKKITINKKFYKDKNGHRGVFSDEELQPYIENIYKTLLTRGVKGLYMYVVDEQLKEHIQSVLERIHTTPASKV